MLDEERLAWRSALSWDFTPSAELVRRFVKIQALDGFALLHGSQVVGYAYYVCEERKGLVGDIFVVREHATAETEDMLLGAVLHAMIGSPHVERIEAQLIMLHGRFDRAMPLAKFAQIYPRVFMVADLDDTPDMPPANTAPYSISPWDTERQDNAAILIANAYRNHVDSSINDQYRSYAGARRFLNNIVNYPGCGAFQQDSSFLALNSDSEVAGLILGSLVAPECGHITQVCVGPETQGKRVGYELVRRSMRSFAEMGCAKTSLTVTASNTNAIRLYQNTGFRAVRRFAAYVWEGF